MLANVFTTGMETFDFVQSQLLDFMAVSSCWRCSKGRAVDPRWRETMEPITTPLESVHRKDPSAGNDVIAFWRKTMTRSGTPLVHSRYTKESIHWWLSLARDRSPIPPE